MKICKIKILGIKFLIIFSIGLFTLYSPKLYATIVIVKDHQPGAAIVLSESASAQLQNAAKVLQDYIKQSTGALLPLINDVQNSNVSIHIGLTAFVRKQKINLENIDEDGFVLKTIGAHNFIIIGGSDSGTEFGLYSFLERYLGVIWLMPTEVGLEIPEHPNLILPETNIIDNPYFLSRQISSIDVNSKDILGIWGRYNKLKSRIYFQHNLLNLLNPQKYYRLNPQFYPIVNGKRVNPAFDKWQPNFSAPGIVDSVSNKILAFFNANPRVLPSYSLGINDNINFDQSPQSLDRRNGKRNYLGLEDVSDDYFKWANEVVTRVTAKYPHIIFGLLAYNNVTSPPSKYIGVNANIVPYLTYERLRWSDTILKRQGHQLTEDWANMCTSLGWYDYAYGGDYLIPRVWFHEMQDYLIWGSEHHVKYYYAELYANWGEGPKPWIQSKLLWNPYQNVDSLLDVWYIGTAGMNAAPKLTEFYAIWEKFWTRDIHSSKWNTNDGQYLPFNNLSYLNDVPEEYIRHADSLMEEAYSLAGTARQKQRVSELKVMWKVYKTALETYKYNKLSLNKKEETLLTSPEFLSLLDNLENDPLHSQSVKFIKLELHLK